MGSEAIDLFWLLLARPVFLLLYRWPSSSSSICLFFVPFIGFLLVRWRVFSYESRLEGSILVSRSLSFVLAWARLYNHANALLVAEKIIRARCLYKQFAHHCEDDGDEDEWKEDALS